MNRSYSLAILARAAGLSLLLTSSAYGAQFQFGTLIEAGFTSTAPGNWEVAAGATPGDTTATSSLGTYWVNNQDRLVQIEYLKATNTVNLRVYADGTSTSASTQISYNPTGGTLAAADAIWTLPASSFFVTATTGPTQATSIQLTNITISGVSGAINTLQPVQQTTLLASRAIGGALSTVAQSQDVVFQADSTGSWQLSGLIRLSGIQGGGRATGGQLAFNFGASASDVPEPGTLGLTALGFGLLGLARIKKFSSIPAKS